MSIFEREDEDSFEANDVSEAVEKEKTDEMVREGIEEKSDYSKEVNDRINSVEELEIYKNAGLYEKEINERKCLIREDIDYDYIDEKTGLTNRELMEKGRAPYDAKTGERIELHHVGQEYESPLAELKADSEHGDGKYHILHKNENESWRNDAEKNNHYNNVQRPEHWRARARKEEKK